MSPPTFYLALRNNVLLIQLTLLLYFLLHHFLPLKLPRSPQFQLTTYALTLALITLFAVEETRQKMEIPMLVAEYVVLPFAFFYDLEMPQGTHDT
jgi:hypothetical protein